MLRKYHPADLDALLEVWYQASKLAHPFLSEAFLTQEREAIANLYLPHTETWVYSDAEQLVGFISLNGQEVGGIFVTPALHGQGIGRALMDRARALRGGLKVEVFKANAIGRRFYARYGFEPVKEYLHKPTGQTLLCLRLREKTHPTGGPG